RQTINNRIQNSTLIKPIDDTVFSLPKDKFLDAIGLDDYSSEEDEILSRNNKNSTKSNSSRSSNKTKNKTKTKTKTKTKETDLDIVEEIESSDGSTYT